MTTLMKKGNLFEGIPAELPEELTEVLARGEGSVRVERMVSKGHASVDGFWYEQVEEELVVVLKGEGVLRFEDETGGRTVEMKAGDWIVIPVGCRHRVEWTSEEVETVWLAVFFSAERCRANVGCAREAGFEQEGTEGREGREGGVGQR